MAENTAIEWADSTWSPWEGCTKVSPGCDHCYAERMNRWLQKGANWGPGAPRRTYSDKHWQKPLDWNDAAGKAGKRLSVFPSVCDPFDNEVDEALRGDFLWLVEKTPHLDWLLLTKRIGNVARMLADLGYGEGLPNARIGATFVNQEEFDRDWEKLAAVPAPGGRFISYEPALGPLNISSALWQCCGNLAPGNDHGLLGQEPDHCCGNPDTRDALHWVIAGGESGPGARPAHPDWYRSLRDQCSRAGVPFLFKQWGEWAPISVMPSTPTRSIAVCAQDGSTMNVGEANARLDDGKRFHALYRIGKAPAGRLLDGVEHTAFPHSEPSA